MIRLLCLLFCLILVAPIAQAQKAKTDPRMFKVEALISEKNRGFEASQAILNASFASHLHGPQTPTSPAELSALDVHYDPRSGTRLSAGILIYHLAQPIDLLRQISGPQNEAFVRIFEIRLLMLADQTDRALDLVTQTLTDMDATGNWSDPQLTSLLADAAVLSHRAGKAETAQRYFTRAMACGEIRCPRDLVFRWLGPKRNSLDPTDLNRDNRDDRAQLRTALDATKTLLNDETILAEVQIEADLFTGTFARTLAQTVRLIQAGALLSRADQRRARLLADRLMTFSGLDDYYMGAGSAAGQIRDAIRSGDIPGAFDLGDIEYLDTSSYRAAGFLRVFPLISALLDHSDRSGDWIIADLLRARLLLITGDARALPALQDLITKARAAGFDDAQLFSPLTDLWAGATLNNDTELANQIDAEIAPCRATPCQDDVTLRYFSGLGILPKPLSPDNLGQQRLILATSFVEETFPEDRMRLADLYPTFASDSRPMDAADNAELHMLYAESAVDPDPTDLVGRATDAMSTLVYAGRYNTAMQIGDRIAARVPDAALSGGFFQIRARAAHRIDDPSTEDLYRQAIARGGGRDLALDLLDTPFLDLLERALDAGPDDVSIRARLRYRQGRYAEAADLLAEERLQREAAVDDVEPYTVYWDLKLLAFQEAHYRDAAGEPIEAERLRNIGNRPTWFHVDWVPLPDTPRIQTRIERGGFSSDDSYSMIRDLIEMRDKGNYEGAAQYMKTKRHVAVMADANGTYLDAQTLWQMAFTFVRAGETRIAFELMNRAARIAATLSFEGAGGAGGGTLQLLERDRWRYLLFVDIAWAALSGQSPEDMVVVSRY